MSVLLAKLNLTVSFPGDARKVGVSLPVSGAKALVNRSIVRNA
jgi:hypothetical protein